MFPVVGFGSGHTKLFPRPVIYDDANFSIADEHARNLQADLGGTELLAPLRDVLSTPVDPMFPRQVFILVINYWLILFVS